LRGGRGRRLGLTCRACGRHRSLQILYLLAERLDQLEAVVEFLLEFGDALGVACGGGARTEEDRCDCRHAKSRDVPESPVQRAHVFSQAVLAHLKARHAARHYAQRGSGNDRKMRLLSNRATLRAQALCLEKTYETLRITALRD